LDRLGVDHLYLITDKTDFSYRKCNIVYTKYKPYSIRDFVFFSLSIKKLGLDVLHSPFYSGFFNKPGNLKSIVTVHDLMFRRVNHFFSGNVVVNKLKAAYFDFIVRRTLRNADVIISISRATKQDILDLYRLESTHIPENSELTNVSDMSILLRHNLSEKSYFFYCGNSRSHKNLEFIIKIFNVNTNLPPLVLAGKGHVNSANVTSVGTVSDAELKALYQASIAFVFPSKYEGFGLPILESLRLKTPVIASRIPAFQEFDSKNIYFFTLGSEGEFLSAVYSAISNGFLAEQNFFKKYDQENIYKLTDCLLMKLINN